MSEHALITLLREDGVEIPETDKADKPVLCWLHDDTNASNYVNATTGQWFCHGCKARGNVWTYLADRRGLSGRAAYEVLKALGWSDKRIETAKVTGETIARERQADREGRPKYTSRYYWPDKASATHDYVDESGGLIVRLVRYVGTGDDGRKLPKVLPYTPREGHNGWWQSRPDHTGLPEADRHHGKMPLYRLPQLLEVLKSHPTAPVMVVEGEKCADAIAAHVPVVCGWHGSSGLKETDWTPLANRKLHLVADADVPGRDYMRSVASRLARQGGEILMALPPGEQGYDVSRAHAEGGWDAVMEWLKPHWRPFGQPSEEDDPDYGADEDLGDNEHYQVLGFAQDRLVVQEKATYAAHFLLTTRLMDPNNHLLIAPLPFWKGLARKQDSERGARFREWVANELLEAGRRRGQIRVDDAYGRGAFAVEGAVGYHTGHDILLADDVGRLTRSISLSEGSSSLGRLFTPRPRLRMVDDVAARDYAAELFATIMEYPWSAPAHGRIYLGWMVTSLIGGALLHRPVVWLLGESGSGKSTLLEYTLDPLHGEDRFGLSDPTEAGLASAMQSDSLPVTLDEFEPTRHEYQVARIEHIMKLMRQATGGMSRRIRGTQTGGHLSTRPRFSLLLSSISQPRMSGADESRIVTIQLAREPVADWPGLYRRIQAATAPARMAAIRTEIVRATPEIVTATQSVTERLAAQGVNTRHAQTMGALTAGAGWLSGDPAHSWPVLAKPSRAHPDAAADPLAPLMAVLSIPQDNAGGLSIANMLHKGWTEGGSLIVTERRAGRRGDDDCRARVQRLGWRVHKGQLVMALGSAGLKRALSRTDYAGHDLDNLVLNLAGVTPYRGGKRHRIEFGNTMHRAVVFSTELVDELGIFGTDEDD